MLMGLVEFYHGAAVSKGLPASRVATKTRRARVDGQKLLCYPGGSPEEHSGSVLPAANQRALLALLFFCFFFL